MFCLSRVFLFFVFIFIKKQDVDRQHPVFCFLASGIGFTHHKFYNESLNSVQGKESNEGTSDDATDDRGNNEHKVFVAVFNAAFHARLISVEIKLVVIHTPNEEYAS